MVKHFKRFSRINLTFAEQIAYRFFFLSIHTDHRIAMAFAIAGINATAPITVKDCANVETSFPDFVGVARNAGLDLIVQEQV